MKRRLRSVVLDATPLSLVSDKPGKSPEIDDCRLWLESLLLAGHSVYIPEIADYEVRRELIRAGKTTSVRRLDALKTPLHYIPLTTEIMLSAANLWAQLRNAAIPTASNKSLDGDVILAATALSLGLPNAEIIIATANVRHISRLVPYDLWRNITPGQ